MKSRAGRLRAVAVAKGASQHEGKSRNEKFRAREAPLERTGLGYRPDCSWSNVRAPTATRGQICLADTRDLSGTTLFAQIAANCQAAGGVALLLIRDSAVTAPSAIPVFVISTANGDFLRNTVKFNATTGISNYPIRINVAKATPPSNPTGQHNCPDGQAVAAYVGPGTAKYTPNESLCLPAGAGQAVEPSMTVDSQGTIYVEPIRGV